MSSNTSDDDRTRIITSVSACMALALIATAMRFASRRVKRTSLIASDYLSIFGLLCACVVSSITILQTHFGLGLHVDRVSMPNIRNILLTAFLGEISYSIGFTFIKLSILALYRHIFPTRFIKLHLRSKVAVSLIFMLGSFVIIASGLRLKSMLSMNETDMTWSYVGIALWSAVEIDLGVVSCCLPVMRPMLAWLIPEAIKNKRAQEFHPLQNS
ncbi:hypothetical protein VP1G_08082 [Cytospora mali]|uniref:Rhodopsin domain-containing protein n=1 Tax=Cytospora mali TaxID=578113 RepID=A0A194VA30_CYTMA|nr:hypothetical protein VP1G_08082 [Valsa mali var. pyri (nom. inval.)]